MSHSRFSFRHWRISSKLLVVMLLLSLVPLLLAAWIINASSVEALTRQTQEGMTRLGNSMALHISNALGNSQGLLSMAANDPGVLATLTVGATPGAESTLNTAVANLLQANERIDAVGIYDATGTAMAHTDPATIGRNVVGPRLHRRSPGAARPSPPASAVTWSTTSRASTCRRRCGRARR